MKWNGAEARFHCPALGHADKNPSCDVNADKGTFLCRSCGTKGTLRDFAGLLGVSYPFGSKRKGTEPEAVYQYHDEDGELRYEVVKLGKDHSPPFFCRRPDGTTKGAMRGITPIPYRLPRLLKAIKEGVAVFITEGEKDVHTLEALGVIATTNHGGGGKWTEEHSKWIPEGTDVYLCGDADEPGEKHIDGIGKALCRRKCKAKVVDLGYELTDDHGKDVTDWVAEGHTREEFAELVLSARPWARADLPALITSLELTNKTFEPPAWIVEGILPDNGLAILAGKPKLGKSWFALQLACSLSAGGVMLGNIPVSNLPTLFLALEDTERRLQDRIEKVRSNT